MNRAIAHRVAFPRTPPALYFLVSAIFHYLGPAFAVLLFSRVAVPGVAWLRIASAAVVFAAWRRPWRGVMRLDARQRRLIVALGVVLAAMNLCFYFAVSRLPLSTVGAIEFIGPVVLAAYGMRTRRNKIALTLTALGVITITRARLFGEPAAFAFAFANCALFLLYIMLGHRIANGRANNIDQLACAMLVATVAITPFGLASALPAFSNRSLLLAGAVVGICSSVIPYVTDQLAMARLPRATFALMISLLPVFATIIGAVVLHQIPTFRDTVGIAFVTLGVALHQQEAS